MLNLLRNCALNAGDKRIGYSDLKPSKLRTIDTLFARRSRKPWNILSSSVEALWYYCCNMWNKSFCLPKKSITCFLSWLDTLFHKFDRKLWIFLFYQFGNNLFCISYFCLPYLVLAFLNEKKIICWPIIQLDARWYCTYKGVINC